jgi:biotin carboxyl carrier protein
VAPCDDAGARAPPGLALVILEVHHGQERIAVDLGDEPGNRRIRLGEREVECDWRALGEGRYSILIDGRVHDVTVDLDGEACTVRRADGAISLRVVDPRRLVVDAGGEEGDTSARRIVAEMPGKVVRLLVAPGDSVAFGQGLLVLEAMKMQNEIPAPRRGTVQEVAVAVGAAVNSGDFLLSLE